METKSYIIILNDNVSMDNDVVPFLRKLLENYVKTLFINSSESED
jgi:hypothetical protein